MRLRLLLAVPLVLAFAPAPKPKDDAKSEQKNLQGTWAVVRAESDGKVDRGPVSNAAKLVIRGDTVEYKGGKTVASGRFVLDPKKKPKEITLPVEFNWSGESEKAEFPAIYKLEKDTLTICFAHASGLIRPKEFVTKPGSGHCLFVFQRVKP